MIYIPEIKKELDERLYAIWSGTSGLPKEVEDKYRARWLRQANGPPAPPAKIGYGPGTELFLLFQQLSVKPPPDCDCEEYAEQMNRWGIAECRARKQEICDHLRESKSKWSWTAQAWNSIRAGAIAAWNGLPMTLEGNFDEAMRRAEVNEEKRRQLLSNPGLKKKDAADDKTIAVSEALTVRNLLYHLYPVAGNGVWQWNVEQLMQRMELFNGKRVIGIVTDQGTSSVREVQAAFRGSVEEWVIVSNDSRLREVKTFDALFAAVESRSPNEATFYGHSKGIRHDMSHKRGTTATIWAEMMYEANLDYWLYVQQLLESHPCAGAFKKVGHGFGGSQSRWHYSGSFFWFRNADLFSRNWRVINRTWYGIEPYLSLHFGVERAGCIFKEGVVGVVNDGNRDAAIRSRHLDMYDWRFCHLVKDEWEAWKQRHQHSHRLTESAG